MRRTSTRSLRLCYPKTHRHKVKPRSSVRHLSIDCCTQSTSVSAVKVKTKRKFKCFYLYFITASAIVNIAGKFRRRSGGMASSTSSGLPASAMTRQLATASSTASVVTAPSAAARVAEVCLFRFWRRLWSTRVVSRDFSRLGSCSYVCL